MLPQDLFHEFLHSISDRFTPAQYIICSNNHALCLSFSVSSYDILRHNCNNFSNEITQFLTGNPIPSFITGIHSSSLPSFLK